MAIYVPSDPLDFFLRDMRSLRDEFDQRKTDFVYLFNRLMNNYTDLLTINTVPRHIFDMVIASKKGLRPMVVDGQGIKMTADTNLLDIVSEKMVSFHGIMATLSNELGLLYKFLFERDFGCFLQFGDTRLHPHKEMINRCAFCKNEERPADLQSAMDMCANENHKQILDYLFSYQGIKT